ncbi:prepilin-type N-terminal cleavage/methylation domain-containing protein [Massilia sp. B-10]|nr:prepilin-type N-terminal cleavage/methylation domain-containing protein [Massilia sp. B-10]UUZ55342.1 prepilin-type N-terminal cleavage/methylation domain-containing protein [Massilia sp. H-1]
MKPRQGMTLVELLIVMAIVGVLAALAYPSYANYVLKTRRTEGQVALLDAMQQQERYYSENNRYLPFSADTDTPGNVRFRWWSGPSARKRLRNQRAGLSRARSGALRRTAGGARHRGSMRAFATPNATR